ncbi:hypothetical protein U2F10_23325 [Leptothoe sp. EHU-05/26/07-4]
MTTQKEAASIISKGGRIHNNILLDVQGQPVGTLKDAQIKNLIAKKGLLANSGYDGTVTVQ